MPEAGGTDVRVTRAEDGTVRIGVPAAGTAFTRTVLDVAGAVLSRPVLGPPGLPAAEIHDPGRAQQWLWAVYGERTAAAVHVVSAEPPGAIAEVTPTEPDTALAGYAARLALGHWAARWWPASYTDGIPALEPDVLGLELAALTHRCQQLFDDPEDHSDGSPVELLQAHQAALDPLIQWWRAAGESAGPGGQLDDVLRLIDDAADCAGLDGHALRRLRSSLETGPGTDTAHDARTSNNARGPQELRMPLDLGSLFARPGDYALAAGEPLVAGGRVIARGSGTNDWRRYPPGFVDSAENAVSWTVSAVGAGRRIGVEVVADVAAPVDGVRLAAEVRMEGGPPTRVSLARRGDVWAGRADIDVPASLPPRTRTEVAVLLPGFDPGPDPGSGPERDLGTASGSGTGGRSDRDAVRALVRRRLAAVALHVPQDTYTRPFLAEIAAVAASAGEDF
ncbi:hypothetical protein OHS59_43060 [Streptomyces sp. NBC_00414]|uniref:hypothetical protein n=1 Tax=Streptomyces sp. NBC_00414 TaxID=2975739 RepID=UPI002E22D572